MKDVYVVYNPSNGLYLTGVITGTVPLTYQWGNPDGAITYETLSAAQAQAASIGGGTVGTTKP